MSMRTLALLLSTIALVSCKEGTNKQPDKADTSAVEHKIVEQVTQGKHPAEDSMVFYLAEIERMRADGDYDHLNNANRVLMAYMKKICSDESILLHELKVADSLGMKVLTSDDRKFRIYCWDTWTGGTMHFLDAIVQYKIEKGSREYVLNDISESTEEGGDCGFWYSELHTIYANGSKTYYLPVYYGIYSGIEHASGISAYAIEGDKLNNEPRIFKPTGKPLYDISYSFTSGTVDKESAENNITLSADKKTLSIPITDKDRVVTEKSLIYKFDGDKFVYDKNAH
jgi:hypothetical protein